MFRDTPNVTFTVLVLLCFNDEVTCYQRFEFSFHLQADLHPVSFKNNLRIIFGTESRNFKNIEAQLKVKYSY